MTLLLTPKFLISLTMACGYIIHRTAKMSE